MNAITQLTGLTLTEFEALDLDKAHVFHFESGTPGGFNLEDFISVLTDFSLAEPYLRFSTPDGPPIHPSRYSTSAKVEGVWVDRLGDPDAVVRELRAGSTAILDNLDSFYQPIKRFRMALEDAMNSPVECVGFITPGSKSGLKLHYDATDVFLVQLHGRKHWKVYPQVRPYVTSGKVLPPTEQPPALEVILEPGQVLYIPRGAPHTAKAMGELSAHLSVMTFLPTLGELLKKAFIDALDVDRHLPVPSVHGTFESDETFAAAAGGRAVIQVMKSVSDRTNAEWLRELSRGEPRRDVTFLQESMADHLLHDQCLLRMASSGWTSTSNGSGLQIKVGSLTYSMPPFAEEMLKQMQQGAAETVAELCAAHGEQARQLLSFLIQRGIVLVESPVP